MLPGSKEKHVLKCRRSKVADITKINITIRYLFNHPAAGWSEVGVATCLVSTAKTVATTAGNVILQPIPRWVGSLPLTAAIAGAIAGAPEGAYSTESGAATG